MTNDDAATILVLHCSHLETALVWFERVSTIFLPTKHCCCWKSFAAGTKISQIVQPPSVLASILVTLAATTSNFTYFFGYHVDVHDYRLGKVVTYNANFFDSGGYWLTRFSILLRFWWWWFCTTTTSLRKSLASFLPSSSYRSLWWWYRRCDL